MANSSRFGAKKFLDDLFGFQPAKPRVATPNCARCGRFFAAPKRRGRPERYCGAECRRATKTAMTARFHQEHRGKILTPGPCRTCGKPIEIARRPGRLPYFCSPACKRQALHPPSRGGEYFLEDIFDTEPKGKPHER